jgi:hypothetical protein
VGLNLKNITLIIGHSNFLSSTGGTERVILQEAEELIEENSDFIFLYPIQSFGFQQHIKPKNFGLIINGYEASTIPRNQISKLINSLDLKEIRIHHLLSWPLSDIVEILQKQNEKKIKIITHIHDFLFSCPKTNKFCINDQLVCKQKYWKKNIIRWRNGFAQILKISDKIILPSEFMLSHLDSKFRQKANIQAPYHLKSIETTPKKKIAYLGYASDIKGYECWEKLARNALITRTYDLIHIGYRSIPLESVPCIPYNFHNSKECQASKIIRDMKIDFIFLWSQVPESYSFTLQESIAAERPVLTSNKSGNIAYTIQSNSKFGTVFENEYSLFSSLLKKNIRGIGK